MKKKTLIIYISVIVLLAIFIVLAIVFINPKDTNNNSDSNAQGQVETTPEPSDDANKLSDEQIKSVFNSHFDIYYGNYTKGIQIKQLLAVVNSINSMNDSHKVEVIINDENTTDAAKIKTSNTYNVDLEYASDGYINKIIIKEN